MNSEIDNFVGIYKNVYPENFCEHLIEQFEGLIEKKVGGDRVFCEGTFNHRKSDYSVSLSTKYHDFDLFEGQHCNDILTQGLQNCFDNYTSKYSVLKDFRLISTQYKLQKTSPGEGYHVWHPEHGETNPDRVLVFLGYLNDVDSDGGGETEFLYYRKRFRPEKNTMLIWPAGFTHTHRGNTVLSDQYKYVITGWFTFN